VAGLGVDDVVDLHGLDLSLDPGSRDRVGDC